MTCILLRKCIPLSKLEKWSADVDSPIFFTRRSPIYRMHDILASCVAASQRFDVHKPNVSEGRFRTILGGSSHGS